MTDRQGQRLGNYRLIRLLNPTIPHSYLPTCRPIPRRREITRHRGDERVLGTSIL
jgi:hypothetical protein